MNNLDYLWPNLKKLVNKNERERNDIFWKHEYETHGSCVTQNEVDYFSSAISIVKQYKLENLAQILSKRGCIYCHTIYRDFVLNFL